MLHLFLCFMCSAWFRCFFCRRAEPDMSSFCFVLLSCHLLISLYFHTWRRRIDFRFSPAHSMWRVTLSSLLKHISAHKCQCITVNQCFHFVFVCAFIFICLFDCFFYVQHGLNVLCWKITSVRLWLSLFENLSLRILCHILAKYFIV